MFFALRTREKGIAVKKPLRLTQQGIVFAIFVVVVIALSLSGGR